MHHQKLALLSIVGALGGGAPLLAGCEVPETATGLHPEGPPMIQQMFVREVYDDGTGTMRVRSILAIGHHDRVDDDREHPTTSAAATGQTLRLVFDELLIGNYIEEISCRTRTLSATESCSVPDGYSRVPEGANPDDIANCAVADDQLESSCQGPYAVCLNDRGIPCGVLDEDENGSADNTRMIDGQVKVICDSIEVPLNRELSFWQPAGNQLVPAGQSPESSLGPALILRTANGFGIEGLYPTNSTCRVVLADNITDKDHIRPCVPPDGDITQDCTPGDIAAATFGTVPMSVSSSTPIDQATGVATTTRRITINFNVPLLESSLATGFTVLEGSTPRTDFTATIFQTPTNPPSKVYTRAVLDFTADLAPSTTYTVTSNPLDTFSIAMPTPDSRTFTTGP